MLYTHTPAYVLHNSVGFGVLVLTTSMLELLNVRQATGNSHIRMNYNFIIMSYTKKLLLKNYQKDKMRMQLITNSLKGYVYKCISLFFVLLYWGVISAQSDYASKVLYEAYNGGKPYPLESDFYKKFNNSKSGTKIRWGFYEWGSQNIAIPCEYTILGDFKEGMVKATKSKLEKKWGGLKLGGTYGFLNEKGQNITGFVYRYVNDFNEGYAAVAVAESKYSPYKWGFIDKNGIVKIPMSYAEVTDFHNGYASVKENHKKDAKWGLIDKSNNLILPFKYHHPVEFSDNLAPIVYAYGWVEYINIDGTVVHQHQAMTTPKSSHTGYWFGLLSGYMKGTRKLYGFNGGRAWRVHSVNEREHSLDIKGEDFAYKIIDKFWNEVSDNIFYGKSDGHQQFPIPMNRYGESEAFIDTPEGRQKVYIDRHGNWYRTKKERDKNLFSNMLEIAEEGDTLMQMEVAASYFYGSLSAFPAGDTDAPKISEDKKEAYKWFCRAAQEGSSRGAYMAGWMCHSGWIEKDLMQALEWYNKSQEPDAANQIAKIKKEQEIVITQKPATISWLTFDAVSMKKDYAFKIQAQSNCKIESISIYVNGSLNNGTNSDIHDGFNQTVIRTVVLKEGENNIKVIVKNAGGTSTSEKKVTYVNEDKPIIDWLDFPETTKRATLALRAGIRTRSEVISKTVTLNGQVIYNGSAETRDVNVVKSNSYPSEINTTLSLAEGENAVVIRVKNSAGETTSSRTVTYTIEDKPIIDCFDFSEQTRQQTVILKVGIKTKSEIERYAVTLNGVIVENITRNEISNSKDVKVVKANEYQFERITALALREGENKIAITVKNSYGETTSEKTIVYEVDKTLRRLALVIGNDDYKNPCFPQLDNAVNDAKAIYSKLKELGFDMMPIVLNADRTKMWNAINDFINRANDYQTVLIYYSGHGLSPDGGANYLIPINADIKCLDDVKRDGINSQIDLITKLEERQCDVKIALLDCCNSCNVPDCGTKNAANQGGLSLLQKKPEGVCILHAASPTKTAYDKTSPNSKNSPFVEALLECIDNYPNVEFGLFVKKVTALVRQKTKHMRKGEQKPYKEGDIDGEFYLNRQ